MHVEEVYFHLLERGEKTVELRLNDKKRQKINVGDKIQFICKNRPRVVLLF
jgi:ASC-1-like (ASCH) protein